MPAFAHRPHFPHFGFKSKAYVEIIGRIIVPIRIRAKGIAQRSAKKGSVKNGRGIPEWENCRAKAEKESGKFRTIQRDGFVSLPFFFARVFEIPLSHSKFQRPMQSYDVLDIPS